MESKNIEKQYQVPKDFSTLGERLKHDGLFTIRKRTPKQKWLRITKNIKDKYDSHSTKYDFIKKRVQAKTPKQKHSPGSEYFYPSEPEEDVYPETNLGESGPGSQIEGSSHFILDSRLKDFLADMLNIRIPSVKIYANQASDALAKRFSADALAYEDRILFKAGKYDPRDKRGIALLGHELTHAAQLRMENKNVPEHMMTNVRKAEEHEALNNEKRVLRYFSPIEAYRECTKQSISGTKGSYIDDNWLLHTQARTPMTTALKTPVSPRGHKEPSKFSSGNNQLSHVQTALSSRDLRLSPETNTGSNTATELSERQLRLIKDEVYLDIMDRIRIEFERGG